MENYDKNAFKAFYLDMITSMLLSCRKHYWSPRKLHGYWTSL